MEEEKKNSSKKVKSKEPETEVAHEDSESKPSGGAGKKRKGVEGGAAKPVSDAKTKSSKSGGDGKKKDPKVKEPQPKPTKEKKPKKADKAIDPAKARQSRKSAAYHKAKKDALQSGKPEEEAKALAKRVTWMC